MTSNSTPTKPIILTLLDTPAFGGAEQYVLDCLTILHQAGHPIVLATNNNHVKQRYEDHIKKNKLENFEIMNLPYLLDAIGNWKGLLKFFFYAPGASWWFYQTLKKLKRADPNLICFFAGWSDRMLFSPIAKYLQTKLIWIEIGPLKPVFRRAFGFPKFLYSIAQHFPDHVITTCLANKKSMIELSHIKSQQITPLYPGVKIFNKKELASFEKIGEKWRQENLDKEEVMINFVGRMAQENEVDLVLKAVALVLKKRPNQKLRLVLVGDGSDKAFFQKIAQKISIAKNTIFTGFISTQLKFSILKISDIFIYPRAWEWEGFGMTTIEALTVGTAVISPRFGPQLEIIQNEKNGLHFQPKNPLDLARQIIRLIDDKKLRKKLGKQGLPTVKNNFSKELLKKRLLKVIDEVSTK